MSGRVKRVLLGKKYHEVDWKIITNWLFLQFPLHQDKEISYSELDLHKPKKFATLSFGLKKKKKKYEDSISKSTFGLHVPDSEESSMSTVSNCPPVSTHLCLLTAVILYDTILPVR